MRPIQTTVTVNLDFDHLVMQSLTKDEMLQIVEAVCLSADYQQDTETKQKVADIVRKYNIIDQK